MAQKILAGRCADPTLSGDVVSVKVDQIVLARQPLRAIAEAREAGLKKTSAEVAIVYDPLAVTSTAARARSDEMHAAASEVLAHGVVIGRPGVGFPAPVHLERFASPARLCVTDEPRLAGVGGIGMLTLVVSPGMLGQALAHGSILVRPPRSVQVLLSGRTRPFVCARDVALELVRRGLGEAVSRIEAQHHAPVVIEFAGPSARLLSVSERAVLAGLAPQLGAAGALFVSDERTEVFLRDQRRSKAHRALVPDAGAPCDEVLNVDLGAVDPLYMDETGAVRSVREIVGKPVTQVLLGGDSGATLRDLFAAAALLKSKRVPARVEFLVAVPSRQMLEVLAASGALTDLIATGARLVEPDGRVMSGELYPPAPAGLSARTHDLEPGVTAPKNVAVASAETLAFAVATGEMGDPRSFKWPVRVTIPRALPTDDVLVVRDRKGAIDAGKKAASLSSPTPTPWKGSQTLEIVDGPSLLANGKADATESGLAVVCSTLDEVRELAARAADIAPNVRAILAPFIPSGAVSLFSGVGIAALRFDAAGAKGLKGQRTVALPAPGQWAEGEPTVVTFGSPKDKAAEATKVPLTWLALGPERAWASAGTSRSTRAGETGAGARARG
ncbi:MAG: 3-isopropylmalate dehydratase [Labilithrix sp.]|nr:3-isopropylmalate dehydratase [Labilithrix sp.]